MLHFHDSFPTNAKRHGLLQKNVGNGLKPFPTNAKRHGLPEIVRGFKTFSSRSINETLTDGNHFQWQKSYHDRIIRNETELNNVRQYILDNPLKWETDPENRQATAKVNP